MQQKDIIESLVILGRIMNSASKDEVLKEKYIPDELYEHFSNTISRQKHLNGWFTKEMVQFSLASHAKMLEFNSLSQFCARYSFSNNPKRIAVIMAGNLPLVGFHDFLCVVLSGNQLLAKLSTDDNTLFPIIFQILQQINPVFETTLQIATGPIKNIDAVIATGSNNSQKYFEQYFGKYPHLFRSNRTGLAILDGTETKEQLNSLGKDIFQYFGLGCRNVSHLLIPKDYDLDTFFGGIISYHDLVNHNKYINNYDYQRATHLLNQIPFLENGFLLLKESEELHSPLSMLFYHRYDNETEVQSYIQEHQNEIQVIVGNRFTPFGVAQTPNIDDFADNIDTMKFLERI